MEACAVTEGRENAHDNDKSCGLNVLSLEAESTVLSWNSGLFKSCQGEGRTSWPDIYLNGWT